MAPLSLSHSVFYPWWAIFSLCLWLVPALAGSVMGFFVTKTKGALLLFLPDLLAVIDILYYTLIFETRFPPTLPFFFHPCRLLCLCTFFDSWSPSGSRQYCLLFSLSIPSNDKPNTLVASTHRLFRYRLLTLYVSPDSPYSQPLVGLLFFAGSQISGPVCSSCIENISHPNLSYPIHMVALFTGCPKPETWEEPLTFFSFILYNQSVLKSCNSVL